MSDFKTQGGVASLRTPMHALILTYIQLYYRVFHNLSILVYPYLKELGDMGSLK